MKPMRWLMSCETARFSFDDATCAIWALSSHVCAIVFWGVCRWAGVGYNHVCVLARIARRLRVRDEAIRSIGRLGIAAGTTTHGTHDATTSDASRAARAGMTRCNEGMKTLTC